MNAKARYRAALEAIANAAIPGVSGGPNGASAEVMEFARRALREPCRTCNVDSDGTRIYPDGQGAWDCPACHGTGEHGTPSLGLSVSSIEGTLTTMRSDLDPDPSRRCICCPHDDGGGHVYCYDVDVPWKTWTGADGDLRGWIHEQLRPFKLRPGLKVRVTVEIGDSGDLADVSESGDRAARGE